MVFGVLKSLTEAVSAGQRGAELSAERRRCRAFSRAATVQTFHQRCDGAELSVELRRYKAFSRVATVQSFQQSCDGAELSAELRRCRAFSRAATVQSIQQSFDGAELSAEPQRCRAFSRVATMQSFQQSCYGTEQRLDYYLVSSSLLNQINNCNIQPGFMSDHSLILFDVNINKTEEEKAILK